MYLTKNFTKMGAILLISLGLVGGIAGAIAMQTHAQDNAATTTSDNAILQTQNDDDNTAITTDKESTTTPADNDAESKTRGHAPLGGDGNITTINGTTISMQEEADEGGAVYTVDASNATITKNNTAASLSDLKVGDKIFVKGTTSGTNVTATAISLGFGGCKGQKAEKTSATDSE